METYSSHPEQGLTIESLFSYYRQAENGQPTKQFDLFDGLVERHAELRGLLNDRNEDVAGCDWVVIPPPGRTDKPSVMAAAILNDSLQNQLQFREFLGHQLTAVPNGFACTNMEWDYVDGAVVPTRFVNPAARRFGAPRSDMADQIMLIDGNSSRFELVDLVPGLWAISRNRFRNPYAAGLMRSCAPWAFFALAGFKDFQVFADMFGLPLAIGYYEEGASGKSRDALEDSVRSIGQDGYAVLSSLTELVIKETARGGDASTIWPTIMQIAESMMTKLITGGSLNTDVSSTGAGSYNAATVHESRAYKMKRHDAKCVEEMFVRDIGRTFIAWNGFDKAAPPMLKIKLTRDELARAQAIEILGQALPISASQIREEFNLREPAVGDPKDRIIFVPTPPPEPGHAREDKK